VTWAVRSRSVVLRTAARSLARTRTQVSGVQGRSGRGARVPLPLLPRTGVVTWALQSRLRLSGRLGSSPPANCDKISPARGKAEADLTARLSFTPQWTVLELPHGRERWKHAHYSRTHSHSCLAAPCGAPRETPVESGAMYDQQAAGPVAAGRTQPANPPAIPGQFRPAPVHVPCRVRHQQLLCHGR